MSANDLARLLNSHQIPIVVLNAYQSGMQKGSRETSLGSCLLMAGAQLMVAMGYSVTVSAARILVTALYRQLLAEREPAAAIGGRGWIIIMTNAVRRIIIRRSGSRTGSFRLSIKTLLHILN